MTMAIVTHEMDFARDVSNRVLYMDEGLIYEDGSPEQIFGNPQKEKTKAFIHRIRSFNYHIDSPNYDLYAMNSEIEQFCEKHVFSKKRINNVLLIVEEFLAINNADASQIDIDLTLSYSEKHDSLEIIFDSIGPEGNIIEKTDADELGITIIKNLTNSINYQRNGERNIIIMSLLRV